MNEASTCFAVFNACVEAVTAGELIESVSARDKEFHFQNWFEARLDDLGVHFEIGGRNTYPDFSIVEYAEGYEVKGLAWPDASETTMRIAKCRLGSTMEEEFSMCSDDILPT